MATLKTDTTLGLRRSRVDLLILILAIAVALTVWFFPSSVDLQARHGLAVSFLVLIMWVTHLLPHAVTGLIGCYLFWALVGIPSPVAFGGFVHPSAWFVFAAGIFGLMTTKTRLAHRLATKLMGGADFPYPRLVLSFVLTSFLLNFLVPSGIARVVILAGIGLGVVTARGWGKEALPARGLFVALTVSSALFDKMMITGGSTIVAQGIIDKIGRTPVYWSQWFFAQLPALLLSIPACWAIIVWLFPAESPEPALHAQPLESGIATKEPWSAAEKRCAFLLITALLLWLTDFLHHIHPAMIALGVAFVATLPGIGVLELKELKQIDFFPFVFTASALSLGDGLMKTGSLDVVNKVLSACWLPWTHSFVPSAVALYWTSFSYHLMVPSDPTTLATSLPTVISFALGHNWSPFAAGLVWTLGLSGKLFVYQSGVTITGFSFGYFQARDFLKVGICLTVFEFLVLLLLVMWYWPLIGLIP